MSNPVAISLSPNTDGKDVSKAIKILFAPWTWKNGPAVQEVEKWFLEKYTPGISLSFNSGRSALFALLNAFGIKEGDEVILQAFTCVAVVDAVLWCGAKPVFVDIDNRLNLDPELITPAITSRTKVIIVQHTFGIPAQLETICEIAKKHKLYLFEDCAHSLGATLKGKPVGTFGDGAIFSFGRDKIISSVFGGLAIVKSSHVKESENLKKIHERIKTPSNFWIFQQILHPILFSIILPLYTLIIGKLILYVCLKIHLLSKPIYTEEYTGGRPQIFPSKFPNALAGILLYQLSKLIKMNNKREEIARFYYDALKDVKEMTIPEPKKGEVYLRYPIITDKVSEIFKETKKKKILLGNWYHHVIDPKGVDNSRVGYTAGSCPKAESAAGKIVNLPTYFRLSERDLQNIIQLIKKQND